MQADRCISRAEPSLGNAESPGKLLLKFVHYAIKIVSSNAINVLIMASGDVSITLSSDVAGGKLEPMYSTHLPLYL